VCHNSDISAAKVLTTLVKMELGYCSFVQMALDEIAPLMRAAGATMISAGTRMVEKQF